MAGVIGNNAKRGPIGGINVTPMVDIMLVLLVIMMVSATYIVSQSLKVDLPNTRNSDGQAPSLAAVTITKDKELYFNRVKVSERELEGKLAEAVREDKGVTLVVSADSDANHGTVVHVMDLARTAGIASFAVNVKREK